MHNTGFFQNSTEITWDFIKQFYLEDKNEYRYCPKLTDRHFDLKSNRQVKLKVKLAAQVLSNSVASGIKDKYSKADAETKAHAYAVADFIQHFDRLFNCFNSRNFKSTQPFSQPFSASSGHLLFLKESLDWLKTVTPRPIPGKRQTTPLPCLDGWRRNIVALEGLWEDLSVNCDFKFLLTARLTQDCIENFFSRIRCNSAGIRNPSAQEFRYFYRNLSVDSLVCQGQNSNCQPDDDAYGISFSDLKHSGTQEHHQVSAQTPELDPIDILDEHQDREEEQGVVIDQAVDLDIIENFDFYFSNSLEEDVDDTVNATTVIDYVSSIPVSVPVSDCESNPFEQSVTDCEQGTTEVLDLCLETDNTPEIVSDQNAMHDSVIALETTTDQALVNGCVDNIDTASIPITHCDRGTSQTPDAPDKTVINENAAAYLSGYIAMKVAKSKHICSNFKDKLKGNKNEYDYSNFIAIKQYEYLKQRGLTVPSHELHTLLLQLNVCFLSQFDSICHDKNVQLKMKAYLYSQFKSHPFSQRPCSCDLLMKIFDFFISLKTHFYLKKMNVLIKEVKAKQANQASLPW